MRGIGGAHAASEEQSDHETSSRLVQEWPVFSPDLQQIASLSASGSIVDPEQSHPREREKPLDISAS
jgi:hypothetical protein